MSVLPGYQHAFIAIEKLRDYCLNPFHPVGKEKAIVFKSALGLTSQKAGFLKEAVLKELPNSEAVVAREDQYGIRACLDL